ncbi:hypothetical protein MSG28_011170 [Choristoneura fumiferana]|uniref:Uncharacterized protein n=2 Tax=Choristoneura fumiferana TaxID=7141 RepID=A0ACC0KRL3_CHOFU|nr:hypothetical protein MSG28_011170 [Choristoneura fumiferana]
MGAKKFFKNELQVSMFNLEHESAPDFYLSCWQKNRSCLPLLFIRGLLCGVNIATVIASMIILTDVLNGFGFWWIYLTHWGVVANTLTTIFAFGMSLRVYLRGPIDSTFGLPWYFKLYWFLYNASVPVALLITIFYWSFISGSEEFMGIDPTLDVFLHAVNSVVMLCLLFTTRHPTRLLHFYHAVIFGVLYLVFCLIYYFAGGLDPNGNVWIYPMLDWSNPGPTSIVVVLVAVGIILLHVLVDLLALCRNYFSRRYRKDNSSFSVSR